VQQLAQQPGRVQQLAQQPGRGRVQQLAPAQERVQQLAQQPGLRHRYYYTLPIPSPVQDRRLPKQSNYDWAFDTSSGFFPKLKRPSVYA
jgi:hypothetical protein